jgi:UDP-N-acetyl-D-galactosamine dehydrogenase
MVGYHPEVILAGRRINDGMGKFVAEQTVKLLVRNGWQVNAAPVIVLGLTFKEDCPDLRNSRVIDVIRELQSYGIQVVVHDPGGRRARGIARIRRGPRSVGTPAEGRGDRGGGRAQEFKARPLSDYLGLLQPRGVVADVKCQFDAAAMEASGVTIWRL